MNFIRNSEIKKLILLSLIVTGGLAVGGWFIAPLCSLAIALTGLLLTGMFLLFTKKRYDCISSLSDDLNKILCGSREVSFTDYTEGELAVLQNELSKMTARLFANMDSLLKDKLFLADALADVSHQLRTPLTSINLIISMLSSPETDEAQRLRLLTELRKLVERTEWLIEALLKLSRLDSGTADMKSETIRVNKLVKKALEPILVILELRNITITENIPDDAIFKGDLLWSAEALGNILKNCAEHTPEDGTITISAVCNALYTEITVSDTGDGFATEDIPNLFERFYKGKNASTQSIGIGLALAKAVFIKQNGVLKARNRPEGGAEFSVRFHHT